MAVNVNREKCIYCGGCTSVCPASALELKETGIDIDIKKCINCGKCVRFCPAGALWL
jgi:Fe-S-cluster-containing hydrogenase component 2